MGGISAGEAANIAKSVCLSLIGGVPLMGTVKSFTEGAPVAKQLGGAASFSMPSLNMVTDALGGMNPEAMLGKVFENPMGSLTSAIGDKLSSLPATLESTFVELVPDGIVDPLTGLEGTMRAIKAEYSNLDLASLDGLKNSVSGMVPSVSNFSDITDKISGVKLPTYGTFDNIDMKDFGMPQVASIAGSFDSLSAKIPSDLDGLAGGVKNLINTKLDTIVAPINSGTQLSSLDGNLTSLVSDLQAYGSGASGAKPLGTITGAISDGKSFMDTTYTNSRETMSRFVEGSKTLGYVDIVSSNMAVDDGNLRNKAFVTSITKPSVMTQIQEGIAREKAANSQV